MVLVVALAWRPTPRDSPPPPATTPMTSTEDYLPGLGADLYLPAAATQRPPVVVLVPGGGWTSADRRGLAPLAGALAERGAVAVNVTYRVGPGFPFPVPAADVVCAIDYAADRARRAGFALGPVVVLGHSAGAQLGALAALAPDHFRRGCPYPPSEVTGLIGLSGPYDISKIQEFASPLFGVSPVQDPAAWRDGNPMSWLAVPAGRRALPVLLAHGSADAVVPSTFSQNFAQALRSAGHPVQLELVPGVDHSSIYTPEVISSTVVAWLRAVDFGS